MWTSLPDHWKTGGDEGIVVCRRAFLLALVWQAASIERFTEEPFSL